jgi:sigma-B regulation protein RsbU (phosphoserine phosphatase)
MTSETLILDVSRDWVAAADIQQRFMHFGDGAPEGLDYGGQCGQLHALGGDCSDLTRLGESRLALTIRDASGKGLAAARMIASFQSAIRMAALFYGNDLAAALRVVSRQVQVSSFENRYATLFYGVFDRASREVRYMNASHNMPTVIRRDGSILWLEAAGAPLGMSRVGSMRNSPFSSLRATYFWHTRTASSKP